MQKSLHELPHLLQAAALGRQNKEGPDKPGDVTAAENRALSTRFCLYVSAAQSILVLPSSL